MPDLEVLTDIWVEYYSSDWEAGIYCNGFSQNSLEEGMYSVG